LRSGFAVKPDDSALSKIIRKGIRRQQSQRKLLQGAAPLWYSRVVKLRISAILCFVLLGGCATTQSYTPGATLLSGFDNYKGEMQRICNSLDRWPDRQGAARSFKTVAVATGVGSREFSRLIDLDLRKREFNLTLRNGSVRPERAAEMKEELVKIDEEIAALKPIVHSQIADLPLGGESQQRLESAATVGLVNLAIDNFSSTASGFDAPSTKVGGYLITDLGSFARVSSPDGRIHRCTIHSVPEEGGALHCETMQ
jgi:hypothetical protein